jgi:hypothetical protein
MKIYILTIIIGQRNGAPLIEITCNAVQDNIDGINRAQLFIIALFVPGFQYASSRHPSF